MRDLNSVSLTGFVPNKIEFRYPGNGEKALLKFKLMVNRNFTNEDGETDTDYPPIEIWGDDAEFWSEKLQNKVKRIAFEGRIRTRYRETENNKYFDVFLVPQDNGITVLEWEDNIEEEN